MGALASCLLCDRIAGALQAQHVGSPPPRGLPLRYMRACTCYNRRRRLGMRTMQAHPGYEATVRWPFSFSKCACTCSV
jgi:hypothetical protein